MLKAPIVYDLETLRYCAYANFLPWLSTVNNDETRFDGAGFSLAATKEALQSIASNCIVDDGEVTNAVEVFWTPGDPKETLTSRDCIVDFPELVTL